MFKSFIKNHLSTLCAFFALNALISPLEANECWSGCNRFYIGAFGGELFSTSPSLRQTGTAFFIEGLGGPLAIDARGVGNRTSPGFGGVQVGYAWQEQPFYIGSPNWVLTPAVEAEAFFYKESRNGELINIAQDRLDEHDFLNSFNVRAGVYVANAIFTLNSPYFGRFAPYVGVGIGGARLSIKDADSLQISPPEPGVNHFNTKRNDADWTLALQAKGGIQFILLSYLRLFAEYRFLSIDTSRYTLGSTLYPFHPPTTTWNFDMGQTSFNGFALGIQFDL